MPEDCILRSRRENLFPPVTENCDKTEVTDALSLQMPALCRPLRRW
jgi:hypothetical protein